MSEPLPATDPSRTRTVRWVDPVQSAGAARGISGIDFLKKLVSGEIPPPPISELMGFSFTKVESGYALFECDPGEYLYNPIGMVHGGLASTLLDSCMSCAIQTTVPAGSAYTTLELKVHLVRAITAKTGHLRAEGKLVHGGRSIGTAEGKLIDANGKLYAHGTTTCMIMKLYSRGRSAMIAKVAVIQKPPVLLDRTATIALVVETIGEVAREGAALAAFPEAYVPGYPAWVWRLQPGRDGALNNELHAQLRQNSVNIARGDLKPICEVALKHKVTIALGIHEIDSEFSGTTLFNTVVIIGDDGKLLNRHRKLMPTNPERMVWGFGDARGLRVVDTPVGRIGCLICWENYMPLSRYALYAQNMDILYAPTWDCGDEWIATMKHIAKEGGCWVIGTGTALQGKDLPADFPERKRVVDDEDWLCDGDAVIVRPFGKIGAGPLRREKGILFGEIEREAAARSRRSLDVAGHYARPDVFKLEVNRAAQPLVDFRD